MTVGVLVFTWDRTRTPKVSITSNVFQGVLIVPIWQLKNIRQCLVSLLGKWACANIPRRFFSLVVRRIKLTQSCVSGIGINSSYHLHVRLNVICPRLMWLLTRVIWRSTALSQALSVYWTSWKAALLKLHPFSQLVGSLPTGASEMFRRPTQKVFRTCSRKKRERVFWGTSMRLLCRKNSCRRMAPGDRKTPYVNVKGFFAFVFFLLCHPVLFFLVHMVMSPRQRQLQFRSTAHCIGCPPKPTHSGVPWKGHHLQWFAAVASPSTRWLLSKIWWKRQCVLPKVGSQTLSSEAKDWAQLGVWSAVSPGSQTQNLHDKHSHHLQSMEEHLSAPLRGQATSDTTMTQRRHFRSTRCSSILSQAELCEDALLCTWCCCPLLLAFTEMNGTFFCLLFCWIHHFNTKNRWWTSTRNYFLRWLTGCPSEMVCYFCRATGNLHLESIFVCKLAFVLGIPVQQMFCTRPKSVNTMPVSSCVEERRKRKHPI